ncbi:Integration host factor beta subunit [hydrothermal vent metagenome]|uniref:Integration host factor beta subunit n=1 Tax=hydrothermal vent metagenome TaxID=652676 RepID=A0A3B1CJX3_9ZZZZ
MTKSDMAEKLAAKINVKKQEAEKIINIFTNSIIEALSKGDKVEIRGFGSFRVRNRAEKIGRNPKTGEKVAVPAKSVPFFKSGKDFRDVVDRGYLKRPAE